MNKLKLIGIISIIIMNTACNNGNDGVSPNDTCSVSIITQESNSVVLAQTCSIPEGSFYLDLTTQSETTAEGNWQISFQMLDVAFGETTYPMPSLVLNSDITGMAAAIYENITFDNMENVPSAFSTPPYEDALTDLTSVEYGGGNEIIGYDFQTHAADINNSDAVLLIYYPTSHSTWKIQFSEYDSGIILFKFAEL